MWKGRRHCFTSLRIPHILCSFKFKQRWLRDCVDLHVTGWRDSASSSRTGWKVTYQPETKGNYYWRIFEPMTMGLRQQTHGKKKGDWRRTYRLKEAENYISQSQGITLIGSWYNLVKTRKAELSLHIIQGIKGKRWKRRAKALNNLDEVNKFLERHQLPKLTGNKQPSPRHRTWFPNPIPSHGEHVRPRWLHWWTLSEFVNPTKMFPVLWGQRYPDSKTW